jgi:hypothetical protein
MKLKSLRAFIVARQMFTPTSKINRVKELVQTWQDGARGYNVSLPPPATLVDIDGSSLMLSSGTVIRSLVHRGASIYSSGSEDVHA